MNATKPVTVKLRHNASIPGARWCEAVRWTPTNKIDGTDLVMGSWWDEDEEVAGLLWFGDINAYGAEEIIEVAVDELRVASCAECRVIGEVRI